MIIWIGALHRDQNTGSVNKHNQFHTDYRAVEYLQRQKNWVILTMNRLNRSTKGCTGQH